MGQIPGLGSPTSNINVPFALALTLWLYYHAQGVIANGPRQLHQALRGDAGRAASRWRR